MRSVELVTAELRFVALVEIPIFKKDSDPDVVLWGTRAFVRKKRSDERAGHDPYWYVEAFAVMSITPSPGLPREEVEEKSAPPPVNRESVTTLHGTPVKELRAEQAKQSTGMHSDYIVLSDEERAKGFVRPVRDSYRHVGVPGPKFPLRDLTPEEHERGDRFGYVKYEQYLNEDGSPASTGMFWTQERLNSVGKGCGSVTTMGRALAETYARDPRFYGATFCCHCNRHLPVGEYGEFIWEDDGSRVGT